MSPNFHGGISYKELYVLVFLLTIASTVTSSQLLTKESRCPQSSNTTINIMGDKNLCNVYHECFCTETSCDFVKSHLCPSDTIYVTASRSCEAKSKHNCVGSYLHWISPRVHSDTFRPRVMPSETVNITGLSTFICPSGANNERFQDENICNVFHVCVTRDNKTYDQAFLCPFSSIFKMVDKSTMYCEDTENFRNPCHNKAFYRSIDSANTDLLIKENSLIIETTNNHTSRCTGNRRVEDKVFCNTFHVCANGKDEHFMCENDLLFNPLSGICDYPINVKCFEKQIFKTENLGNVDSKEQKILKSKLQSLILYPSESFKNVEKLNIYGYSISLKCPIGAKNYIYPDREFCNVFHHCHGYSGKVSICEKGQAFDANANGADASGVCNFEKLVNCEGKYILSETGKRVGKPIDPAMAYVTAKHESAKSNAPTDEELISGIVFDCLGKPNGHYRDYIYCDVFHACISNERKKTYSCAHIGERTYFDDVTKKCEFLKTNPTICMHNMFYKPVTELATVQPAQQPDEYNSKWKVFIRSREPFSCVGRMDGFYASRWCNVFYRCFLGIRSEFLCPKMMNQRRLWWVQHDSSQELPQTSAACVWPCETKSKCMSPGGIVYEKSDGSFTESIVESDRVWEASNCEGDKNQAENNYNISTYDFTCKGKPDGDFFPSKYCNIFHRCTNGKRGDFQCPKATNTPYDLWWNDELQQCDWPCKINCTKEVYGTMKDHVQIQAEDHYFNEDECRSFNKPVQTTTKQPSVSLITTKLIKKPFPDDAFVCPSSGLIISPKYCNVYYSCKGYNMPPQFSFYCVDGYFDNASKTCKTTQAYKCPYNPSLTYPLIAISDISSPEELTCAASRYAYTKKSRRYGNVFYRCDGYTSAPKTYRCYDREHLTDAYYSKEYNKCVSRSQAKFAPIEILKVKARYQSTPVDHTRFTDLKPLSCRGDQQYLAEHDKYCNLYHSCILGKYQMYACISIGDFDKTSFFYYTNGNCGAPKAQKCAYNKSVYEYEKLFPNEMGKLTLASPVVSSERLISKVAASVSTVSFHEKFGPIILVKPGKEGPKCMHIDFIVANKKYCNLFYECKNSKLSSFVCIDSSTGKLNGIFDETEKACKPYNRTVCDFVYEPEHQDLANDSEQEQDTLKTESFKTNSSFSCQGRQSGYYESEWCNVYFQCNAGKRIDTRCSSSLNSNPDYDLWWVHQNETYEPLAPFKMQGSDGQARCEWPCKVKCQKKIWVDSESNEINHESILTIDKQLGHECPSNDTASIKTKTLKAVDYRPDELKTADPSGFLCNNRIGVFSDPLFCNIFHECHINGKRSFSCKETSTGKLGLFDSESKKCVAESEGFSKCKGLIYDNKFLYEPAMKNLPTTFKKCSSSGVYNAIDSNEKSYCDLFYWCRAADEMPIFFYCDISYLSKEAAIFNIESKRCELKKGQVCLAEQNIYSDTLKLKMSYVEVKNTSESASKFSKNELSDEFDPAPKYTQIQPDLFKTKFTCEPNASGYYADTDFCDIFHYCFSNGQFKTYACSALTNEFQLWWSYDSDKPRHSEIHCNFSCNENDPKSQCTSGKKILMKSKAITRGVNRGTVFTNVCKVPDLSTK